MQRNTSAALIRLTVWLLAVAITIAAGFLVVDEQNRKTVFWLTISSIVLIETLWAGFPAVRVLRPNLPLPLAATFVLGAYSTLVAILAFVACTTSIDAGLLAALHLVGILIVLVIPLGIVLRGGLFIAEVNEKHDASRETHVQFRNRFRGLVAKLNEVECEDLSDVRRLAAKINDDLAYTVTESVPSVAGFDRKIDNLVDECESNWAKCSYLSETETNAQRGPIVQAILKKLLTIQVLLSERDTINKQSKR